MKDHILYRFIQCSITGSGMCCPVCGMALIKTSSPCSGGSGFFFISLSESPLPNDRRYITVNKMCYVSR